MTADTIIHDAALDATGLLCPLPVLKARKRLKSLSAGGVLCVTADDPASVIDFPHFCTEQGHDLLRHDDLAGRGHVFWIRKN